MEPAAPDIPHGIEELAPSPPANVEPPQQQVQQQPRARPRQRQQPLPVRRKPLKHFLVQFVTYLFGFITCGYMVYAYSTYRIPVVHAPVVCPLLHWISPTIKINVECSLMPPWEVIQVLELLVDLVAYFVVPVFTLFLLSMSVYTTVYPLKIKNRPFMWLNPEDMWCMHAVVHYNTALEFCESFSLLIHCAHSLFEPSHYIMATFHFLLIFYLNCQFAVCRGLVNDNWLRAWEHVGI